MSETTSWTTTAYSDASIRRSRQWVRGCGGQKYPCGVQEKSPKSWSKMVHCINVLLYKNSEYDRGGGRANI